MAFSASGLVLTNHWVEMSGSTSGFAAIALAESELVVLDFDEGADLFEVGDDGFAGVEAIDAGVGAGSGGHHGVFVDDLDFGQIVALAGFEIVEVVRGGDFDHAGAEFGVGQIVEDDGDLAIHQRKLDGLAVEVQVARIFGVDGDGGIAEHGFGARSGDGEVAAGHPVDGVADMPEVSGDFDVGDLEIGERGMAMGAPVDHVLAAVDEALFVEADEDFADGAGEAGVEGEALAAPIAGGAEADHLALDGVAGLGLPLPDALFEFFAAEVAVIDAFLFELAVDHHLGGDAGVIGAGEPEGVVAEHAVPADGDVDLGMLEHVADVEDAGDVGGRNDERKDAPGVSGEARKISESIHHCAQCGSNRWGS